ncbi:MAG: glycosyltransferase 87 family protein [Cyclobacteriaceae bacterium]|nr:glycosyltransferase 87 family protein [Cyclobacteriaceae bacterium]
MLNKPSPIRYVAFGLFFIAIVLISYFFQRHQTFVVLPLYFLSFGSYWYLHKKNDSFTFKELFIFGLICRIILIPSLPILSDDIYRFIWDGRLLSQGVSPFAHIPAYYINFAHHGLAGITQTLFEKLNSPEYFTIYPPVAQLVFLSAVFPFPENELGSIIIIRVLSLLAEVGTLYFMIKLLKKNSLPPHYAFLYFLNPLVILELTGSLHFEGFMIFFLMAGIYYYQKNQLTKSGLFWALAIGTKLIPLIFLPVLLFKNSIKSNIRFFSSLGITLCVLFIPFIDKTFISGLSSSITLYFQHFEFNASIYYIVREIGFWVKGYNIIGTAGKVLAISSFISIITISIISWRRKWDLGTSLMLIIFIYFLFTNILHPWYVTTILALSVFTKFRFTVVWTALIFLTYAGYSATDFQENLWLVIVEYLIVISVFANETRIINFNNLTFYEKDN